MKNSKTISGVNLRKELINYVIKVISCFCCFFLAFAFVFSTYNTELLAASENQSNKLIEKVSKDYTKKFCNGIAFGLSKDSAMKFALNENKQVFSKKKGIESINEELLAERISISVVESCGYPLDLNGEEGIREFKNLYISSRRKN